MYYIDIFVFLKSGLIKLFYESNFRYRYRYLKSNELLQFSLFPKIKLYIKYIHV